MYLGGNLIAWSSKKQPIVARSSAESEYRALAQVATELIWLKSLLCELGVKVFNPYSVICCDNTSATSLSSDPVFHSRTKHIEVDIYFMREKIEVKFQ